MTQEGLAELAGVDQGTISSIETGRIKSPSVDVAQRIARALDMPLEQLFPVSDEPSEARA